MTRRKSRPKEIIYKNALFKKEEPKPVQREVVSSDEDSESEERAKKCLTAVESDGMLS